MKRWAVPVLITLFAAAWVLGHRAGSPGLLADSDTAVLLAALRQREAPLSWFTTDWPLENHFYRPISTLIFEADLRLHGEDAAGFGWTNALLCAASVLALAWLAAEVFGSAWAGAMASCLFGVWHLQRVWMPTWLPLAIALGACALGVLRSGRLRVEHLLVFLGGLFLTEELVGKVELDFRMLGWIPGRTASSMTVFALVALAAYVRYERTRKRPLTERPYSPYEPPATRSWRSAATQGAGRWLALSIVSFALALGSYEQAVIVPIVAACLALPAARNVGRPAWAACIGAVVVLVLYLAVRAAVVPGDVSGYQAQQWRTGPGVWWSLSDYALPAWHALVALGSMIPSGALIAFTPAPYAALGSVLGNLGGVLLAVRVPVFAGVWLASVVAFAPMAWLKHFDHYHYLPMALRALLVVALVRAFGPLLFSAVSPPRLQAPPRTHPAPGSLARR